jgi:hypothetical protein
VTGSGEVIRNLRNWATIRRAATVALAQNWAGTLEGRAKNDAPWQDRTGNARNGLFGAIEARTNEVIIKLGHSVEYGIFLELARDGRYAILKPTLDKAIPDIYRTYKKLWEE